MQGKTTRSRERKRATLGNRNLEAKVKKWTDTKDTGTQKKDDLVRRNEKKQG